MTEPVIAFKALDAKFQCRGFQYEVGKTYTHDGKVAVCLSGFHACRNPMDTWNFYDLIDTRYALVEMRGTHENHGGDTKLASAEITITAELRLPEFIQHAVEWITALVKNGNSERIEAASGNYAILAASGDFAQLAASGDNAKLAASGLSAKLAASGEFAQLAASSDYAKLASSGDFAQLAASGVSAQLVASGDFAKLAVSGLSAKLATSGGYAQLAASGVSAQLAASGADSVIASASFRAVAKGVRGTWISLAEFNAEGKCIGFATGCVGNDGVPADVWLRAKGGKLVEVSPFSHR